MSQTKAQLVGGVGISTAENVVVGSAVTINSTGIDVVGVVTATSFSGDGSGLSNTGSTLSAASGSQRVVVTTQTSGTMTASATDGDLTYDANSDTLNTANLHVTGISTLGSANGIGAVTIGIGTTALLVEGNARVTGILTVGTGSITFDGSNNTITVGSGVTISASTGLTGSGENLTSLNATQLTTGTVPDDRFPATLPTASGENLTSLNASNLSSGTVAVARLGSGSPSASTFLRGDGSWQVPPNPAIRGASFEGGTLICCSGSVYWIVAPSSSEVSRTWANRNDANTTAQSVSGCTGWFVPTCAQLQNPGYTCRGYWDSYVSLYWSSTEYNSVRAWRVAVENNLTNDAPKSNTYCVRAFRCVTY